MLATRVDRCDVLPPGLARALHRCEALLHSEQRCGLGCLQRSTCGRGKRERGCVLTGGEVGDQDQVVVAEGVEAGRDLLTPSSFAASAGLSIWVTPYFSVSEAVS